MSGHHSHSQGHSHSHTFDTHNRSFAIAVVLNTGFVIVEAVYGVLADSLALIADAGHNLSDVMGLLLAWGASWLAKTRVTNRATYGLQKTTILAALFNAVILMAAVGGIAWESIRRFGDPTEVTGITVIVVAGIGVLINGATMMLFMAGRKGDLNVRGAFLHMAADAGISLGVVVAGAIILVTGLQWIDPAVSLLIAAVIFAGTWQLLKDSVNLAVDAVPKGIEPDKVTARLTRLPGVEAAHHLHIWALSTTEIALTVHLVKPDPVGDDEVIQQASNALRHDFNIGHVTIQWERTHEECPGGAHC